MREVQSPNQGCLWHEGWVHGDVRLHDIHIIHNILVAFSKIDLRLIDFDYCGRAGILPIGTMLSVMPALYVVH